MIKVPENTKAIIFDLDGTLADTMPLHYKACQLVCRENGFDFPLSYFLEKAGIPTIQVFEMLVKDLNIEHDGKALGRQKEQRVLDLVHEVKAIAEVESILLSNYNKMPLAIGSGGERKTIELTLNAIGHSDKFDAIVGAEDVQRHKPFPDTFLKAAEQMGVDPVDCLVLEDGEPGIQAAQAAGMMVIDVRPHISGPHYEVLP